MIKKLILAAILCLSGSLAMKASDEIPQGKIPSHFTWGVDLLSSIDMTGNDMTSVAINGFLGYKGDYIRVAGVGAMANMMMGNSSRSFPIYGMLRTSFTRQPSLCFLDLKLGASINDVHMAGKQYGFYSNAALGITLARGVDFSSHILIGYTFMARHDVVSDAFYYSCPDIHMASIGIGISF